MEEIEKKLVKTQNETELLQQEYLDLQGKMSLSREKYKRAALLMTEFLDNLLNSAPNILETDPDFNLDLERIKATPFEDLEKDDKVAIVLTLLKQLQPFLSANNLSTAMAGAPFGMPAGKHQRGGSHFIAGQSTGPGDLIQLG